MNAMKTNLHAVRKVLRDPAELLRMRDEPQTPMRSTAEAAREIAASRGTTAHDIERMLASLLADIVSGTLSLEVGQAACRCAEIMVRWRALECKYNNGEPIEL